MLTLFNNFVHNVLIPFLLGLLQVLKKYLQIFSGLINCINSVFVTSLTFLCTVQHFILWSHLSINMAYHIPWDVWKREWFSSHHNEYNVFLLTQPSWSLQILFLSFSYVGDNILHILHIWIECTKYTEYTFPYFQNKN